MFSLIVSILVLSLLFLNQTNVFLLVCLIIFQLINDLLGLLPTAFACSTPLNSLIPCQASHFAARRHGDDDNDNDGLLCFLLQFQRFRLRLRDLGVWV